jgi:acyl-CoA synthetase (AMP-forming)/AMP-acid ligase II
MYPGKHAATDPQRPAFIMAQTGAVVSYGELEARTNRLAHLLRVRPLVRPTMPSSWKTARAT